MAHNIPKLFIIVLYKISVKTMIHTFSFVALVTNKETRDIVMFLNLRIYVGGLASRLFVLYFSPSDEFNWAKKLGILYAARVHFSMPKNKLEKSTGATISRDCTECSVIYSK
jgi:hypothetical protein